jgi:glutamate N-acetyltransferase/amino-acid N-acetyltransferase
MGKKKFNDAEEYKSYLKSIANLPEGFKAGVTSLKFVPEEKKASKPLSMNMSLLLLDSPVSAYSAVFTKNAFPGAPVLVGKERLGKEQLQGILINNKISNVCISSGVSDALEITSSIEKHLGLKEHSVFPSSTGVIGWRLPVQEMKECAVSLCDNLSADLLDVAEAIMTTDAYPKIVRRDFDGGSIVLVGKGAGMIEPNMATMLIFALTDFNLTGIDINNLLKSCADKSFNRISVDSDQSTSDSFYLVSSGKRSVNLDQFRSEFEDCCREMAVDIVRNGEGTAHVLEVRVSGAGSAEEAHIVGKALVNAPLVKTAIFGNDPNVGRLIGALGDCASSFPYFFRDHVVLKIGGETVFKNRSFSMNDEKEKKLSKYFEDCSMPEKKDGFPPHFKNVVIEVDLGLNRFETVVYGSDLTYEYVRENADYRS